MHKKDTNNTVAMIFTVARRFPLFETAKNVPTNKTIVKIYEFKQKIPKKNRLNAFPIFPPNPKLLMKRRSEIATTIHRITSRSKDTSGVLLFPLVPFRLVFDFALVDFFFPEELLRLPVAANYYYLQKLI